MALSRTIIVTRTIKPAYPKQAFTLQIRQYKYILTYEELSKLIADGEAEIRDYLGDEE
tara:strand:+ start:664 stop:837 length:174 start_codon:yes stop_codon:yes gene_type:complete